MRRILPLRVLAAVVAVGLVAAACDLTDPSAATVNGVEISERDFLDELEQFRQNEDLVGALGIEVTAGAVTSELTAGWLGRRILDVLVENEADRLEVEVTQQDRDQALQSNIQRVGGEDAWARFDQWFQDQLVELDALFIAVQDALGDTPGEQELRRQYRQIRDTLQPQACAEHVLVETEDEAIEVKGLLEAGADFADVARERSADQGSAQQGGDLGCAPQGSYVAPFDEAVWTLPTDTVSDPVETQFGFHVIRVRSRGVPSFEDMRAQLEQQAQAAGSQAFTDRLNELVLAADVSVNPKYGTYEPDVLTGQVISPRLAPDPPDGLPVEPPPGPDDPQLPPPPPPAAGQ